MTRTEKDETDLACIHADFSHAFQSVTKLENNTDLLSQTIKDIRDKLNISTSRKLSTQ